MQRCKVILLLKCSNGITLVENLVALVLVTAIIVPFSMFMGKLLNNTKANDTRTALHLCQVALEYTIATKDYLPQQWQRSEGKKTWLVKREIIIDGKLIHITIYTKPLYNEKWEFKLYLCQFTR
jgi:Tfp pilus assembly protein PilV